MRSPAPTGTSATFNGTSSRVDLPKGVVKKSRDGAVELWFKAATTGTGGPLLGYQDKAFGTAPGRGVPVLYVGTDGKLRGQFGNGGHRADHVDRARSTTAAGTTRCCPPWAPPRRSTSTVSGSGQTTATLDHALLTYNQLGAATVTTPGSWPAWGTATTRYFTGAIDEVAVYSRPLGAVAVAAHHRYGAVAADQLTGVTMPAAGRPR